MRNRVTWSVSMAAVLLAALVILVVESVVLDFYHEEPTRVLVAQSMLSGEGWIVPRILGTYYVKKPPGLNWLIALFSFPFGGVTEWSARLVPLCSWIGLGGLTYILSGELKRELSRVFTVCAVLLGVSVFIEKAALAEIDLFFAFVLFAGVVSWYILFTSGRTCTAWIVGHLFLGFGLLTKGPPAYLFFYGPVFWYCYYDRKSVSYKEVLIGIVVGHLPAVVWLFAVFGVMSPERFSKLVFSQMFERGAEGNLGEYLFMLVEYPLKVLLSLAPWVFVALSLCSSDVRNRVHRQLSNSNYGSLIVGGLLAFLPLWFTPVDSTRYALPVFPWIALVLGTVTDGLIRVPHRTNWFRWLGASLSSLLIPLLFLPFFVDLSSDIFTMAYVVCWGGALCLLGTILLSVNLMGTPTVKTMIATFALFVLTVKLGYVFLYVPSEKPQRLTKEHQLLPAIQDVRSAPKCLPVHYRMDMNPDVPVYFEKHGVPIRQMEKVQNHWLIREREGGTEPNWSPVRHISLTDADPLMLYIPRDCADKYYEDSPS